MKMCHGCQKREGVHRWGAYVLCDPCHKKYYKKLKSPDETSHIQLSEKSPMLYNADYTHGKNIITLYDAMGPIECTLVHETIHHVLNVLIDPPTSYDFDNLFTSGLITDEVRFFRIRCFE